jgi:hypothetical protein
LRIPVSASLAMTLLWTLTGCQKPAADMMTGGDRDEHGCLGSGGYSWCGRENRCVRTWELAKEKNLADEAVERYCNEPKTAAQ